VVDLSESGAQMDDAPPLQPGAGGTVAIQGLPTPLSFVVRTSDHRGALHVQFEANESARLAIRALLDRAQRKKVA
jgi:hypothetical protein